MSGISSTRDLLRLQVDEALGKWRAAALPKTPPQGWVRTLRGALGMSARALAERVGLGVTGIQKLEMNEANGAITLASLRRLAEALNCDLEYALVPRKPLEEALLDRAKEVAEAELMPVAHTMALEDQRVAENARRKQIEAIARKLVARGSPRQLW